MALYSSGLDYYNARYYDPIAGVFLSADPVEGNLQGMNPYGYVNGNPETLADPSGNMYVPPPSGGGNGSPPSPPPQPPPPPPPSGGSNGWGWVSGFINTTVNVVKTVGDATLGISSMVGDVQTIFNGNASWQDKLWAGADLLVNAGMDIMMVVGVGEEARAVYGAGKIGISLLMHGAKDMALHEGEDLLSHAGEEEATHLAESSGCSGGLSFIAATLVATAHGEQAIGTMHIGEKVLAYNPKSHKMELELVLHVWINHDTDLVDLTLTHTAHAPHSAVLSKISEVLHTNQKHPFLTKEKGFVSVSRLKLGMHVLEANGTYGVVTGWKIVPGAKTMYNLEVAQDHTYTVGVGEWVVHNCPANSTSGSSPYNQRGNQFHYDQPNGGPPGSVAGPSQLQAMYPQTDFEFKPQGAKGADVEVVGGTHPSSYPGSTWYSGSDFGDFKPDNPKYQPGKFLGEIRSGKLPPGTVPIWYDPVQFVITRIG